MENHNISVSFGTIIKTLVILILAWVLFLLRDLVMVILVSVVIASAVEPAVVRFKKYRIPRAPAVLAIYLITIGAFIVILPLFLFPIASDLSSLSGNLPEILGGIPAFLSTNTTLGNLGIGAGNFSVSQILAALQNNLISIPTSFVQTASLIFGGFFSFILIIVISFYLSVQSNGIENVLRVLTPLKAEDYVLGLWQRAQKKIGYWMQGQLLLGLVIGVLVFLGLTIFQIPYALVLAVLAAMFELIPFFGPILSAVPAVLLAFSHSVGLGVLVLGFYLIIQQFENHLIAPLVITKMVGVPPLVVIISLIIGVKLAGFLGLILAVPVATVLMELLSDYEKSKYLFRHANAK
jgi:predicted PurR-regulated permease PerM